MSELIDLQAERQALAFLIADPDPEVVAKSLGQLKGDEFSDKKHRIIFEAIGNLFQRPEPVRPSVINLCAYLQSVGAIDKAGGRDYIAGIPTEIDGLGREAVIDLPVLNERVSDLARRRTFESLGLEIATMAKKNGTSVKEIQGRVTEILAQGEKSSRFQTFGDVYGNMEIAIDRWYYGEAVDCLRTGWASIDSEIGGIPIGELTTLGARPGVGKTRLIMGLANQFREQGLKVVFNSLEMSTEQIFRRELSKRSGVNFKDLNVGKYAGDAKTRETLLAISKQIASEEGIYINDNPSQTAAEMNVRAAMLQLEKGAVDAVFVDYLELMQDVQGAGSDQRFGIVAACRRLKILAKSLKCSVIAASQLNRSAPIYDIPGKDDLMLGGEAEAGMVWILWSAAAIWNEKGPFTLPSMVRKRPDGSPHPEDFYVRIGKNRHGNLGIIRMEMNPVTGEIRDPSVPLGGNGVTDSF